MVELGNNAALTGARLIDFDVDAVKVMGGSTSVEHCYIRDNSSSNKAHRDGIQLIPKHHRLPLAQYAAGEMRNVLIRGNEIHAHTSKLQGVFASDGLFFDVTIINNIISTQSDHKITINGLVSGLLVGNINHEGLGIPIVLNPLRIGGSVDGRCVWVVDFKQHAYQYLPLEGSYINDHRTNPIIRDGDIYLECFDKQAFDSYAALILQDHTSDVSETCRKLQRLACECGVELK